MYPASMVSASDSSLSAVVVIGERRTMICTTGSSSCWTASQQPHWSPWHAPRCQRQGHDGSGGQATGPLVSQQERDPLREQARLAATGAGDHNKGTIWVGMGRCTLVLVGLHRISFHTLTTARRAGWPAGHPARDALRGLVVRGVQWLCGRGCLERRREDGGRRRGRPRRCHQIAGWAPSRQGTAHDLEVHAVPPHGGHFTGVEVGAAAGTAHKPLWPEEEGDTEQMSQPVVTGR